MIIEKPLKNDHDRIIKSQSLTGRRLLSILGWSGPAGKPNQRRSHLRHWWPWEMKGLRLAAVICLVAVPHAADATAVHAYRPSEYDLIDRGLAPNREYAIMAHGDAEGNPENLRLFLFDARHNRRIGPLEEVHDAGLETAAEAFRAQWSADSRHVALSYRIDRHINALVIYRIEGHRAYLITGPKLVAVAAPGLPPEILQDNALSPLHQIGMVKSEPFSHYRRGFPSPDFRRSRQGVWTVRGS